MSSRNLKKNILTLLKSDNFEKHLEDICRIPPRQAVNPIFSFFYNTDELIRWRAVAAMGAVVARLAADDRESARVVMRRLLWNLNDESGGIGWGSPEAMGEIMARHSGLAEEYAHLMVSYIDERGNFIENDMLQRGVLWGLGRLAGVRPRLVTPAAPFLLPFLRSEDATHRGFSAWASGAIRSAPAKPLLLYLSDDNTTIKIFIGFQLVEITVGRLAKDALSAIAQQ